MTEFSFLLELLLEHKLPKVTKERVTERIKEIEMAQRNTAPAVHRSPTVQIQAQSTLAAMDRHAAEEPVVNVAQTPATQAALASRQAAISESLVGKINKETGRPRKF